MMATEAPRVLIATVGLSAQSGTHTYTRDLALALLRRGWLPVVYTPHIGPPAEELRRATIPVVDRIEAVAARPDVIHGHHVLETLTALAKFPSVPALFVCHDSFTWHSIPPRTARIASWVAVDRNCRDRMMFEHGIAEENIHVLANAVDLERFERRGPLPERPLRALVFSNQAAENNFAAPIRDACSARGITLDVMGESSGQSTWTPEKALPQYDLVFAKARCALEAAAAGAAVIICDFFGLGGLLTSSSFEAMRALNLGSRMLQRPITRETIGAEIDRYDAADASAVTDLVRASASVDLLADQYIAIYEETRRRPVTLSAEEQLEDLATALSVVSRSLIPGPPSRLVRTKLALLNSRALSAPVRLLYRLRKRLRV